MGFWNFPLTETRYISRCQGVWEDFLLGCTSSRGTGTQTWVSVRPPSRPSERTGSDQTSGLRTFVVKKLSCFIFFSLSYLKKERRCSRYISKGFNFLGKNELRLVFVEITSVLNVYESHNCNFLVRVFQTEKTKEETKTIPSYLTWKRKSRFLEKKWTMELVNINIYKPKTVDKTQVNIFPWKFKFGETFTNKEIL